MNLLEFYKGNKTKLIEAIEEATSKQEEDYTANSWKALQEALQEANKILADENVMQKEVDEATNEDAENLEIAMGKPIQSFTTTGFNVFGEVIEFSLARYRGDRSRFEVSANI